MPVTEMVHFTILFPVSEDANCFNPYVWFTTFLAKGFFKRSSLSYV